MEKRNKRIRDGLIKKGRPQLPPTPKKEAEAKEEKKTDT